jgi:FkbM family methyltransferase
MTIKKKLNLIFISFLILFVLPSQVIAAKRFYSHVGRNSEGYYSQTNQDKFLHENFFQNKRDGVFIDIGAHNGIAYSNTKFFEELGWSGICIEPIPEVFEELEENRKAICLQGCITNKKGTDKFLRVKGPEMLSGLLDKYHPWHMQRVIREVSADSEDGSMEIMEVDCFLFNDVLVENNIYHVDLLSIDTEGGELDIIKSIDFSLFDIDIIEVENNFNDNEMRDFIMSKGYQFVINIGADDIFRKI